MRQKFDLFPSILDNTYFNFKQKIIVGQDVNHYVVIHLFGQH